MLTMSPEWGLEVQRGPDWLLIRLNRGEDNDSRQGDSRQDRETPPLAERIWALLEQHFTYRLVLDLDELDLLNSLLIGQLIELHRQVRDHDGVIRLCGLSDHNTQVLHTCHLLDRFRPYESRRAAVMAGPAMESSSGGLY